MKRLVKLTENERRESTEAGENERLRADLAAKDAEIERLTRERDDFALLVNQFSAMETPEFLTELGKERDEYYACAEVADAKAVAAKAHLATFRQLLLAAAMDCGIECADIHGALAQWKSAFKGQDALHAALQARAEAAEAELAKLREAARVWFRPGQNYREKLYALRALIGDEDA